METSPESEEPKVDAGPAEKNPNMWATTCGDTEAYFRINNWYPHIQKWTFRTEVIDVKLEEGLAIAKYYETCKFFLLNRGFERMEKLGNISKLIPTGGLQDGLEDYDEFDKRANEYLPAEKLEHIANFEHRLEKALVPFLENGKAAFVKLSTRSPKDAAFLVETPLNYIKEMIEKSQFAPNTLDAEIEDILIFSRAIIYSLAVRSVKEAMTLLTRSQRVENDLHMSELMMGEKNFTISLAIREWNPHILPEWEFRVFVVKGRLTAATQYSNIVFVPDFVLKYEEIKKCIFDFWTLVKGDIRSDDYTIDLALSPDLQHVVIVELNDLPPTAGTSMFDWENPRDKNQILNGENFELRILTEFNRKAFDEIHQPLRKYIDSLRGRTPPPPSIVEEEKNLPPPAKTAEQKTTCVVL